jgi:hypothetical protein
MATDAIVIFYSGGVDHRGRTREEILAWDDERLESVHDYIQWLFPTVAPSAVNPSAPLITPDTVGAFANEPALRERLRESLDRMLRFYGLRRESADSQGERITVDGPRFRTRAGVWFHPGNHNHLRLTRIMQSLRTLGLVRDALALQHCLLELADGPEGRSDVTRATRAFWSDAVKV